MPVVEIIKYPNKILKKKCKPVKIINEEIRGIITDMLHTMLSKNAIGIAANQIGKSLRIIALSTKNNSIVLINPKIIKKKEKVIAEEGCLSFPGLFLKIKRYNYTIAEGLDENNKKTKIEATGLLSRALQHEIDHLNGVTFIDRLPLFKRIKMYLKLARQKNLIPPSR